MHGRTARECSDRNLPSDNHGIPAAGKKLIESFHHPSH